MWLKKVGIQFFQKALFEGGSRMETCPKSSWTTYVLPFSSSDTLVRVYIVWLVKLSNHCMYLSLDNMLYALEASKMTSEDEKGST